ncbi:MAG: trehalose-phosphatase [Geminicoccaceae bacterium]
MTNEVPSPPLVSLDHAALFFDVDGTLVEIEKKPDAVSVSAELRRLLRSLIDRSDGALALVSGRSIDQLDALFQPLAFSASGLHGLEHRMLPSEITRAAVDPTVMSAAKLSLDQFAKGRKGVLVEDKGLTLALHYRMAPEHHEAAADWVRNLVDDSQSNFVLLEGKMVFELKPPGFDKGRAIVDFMQEPPFRGRCPIFAGDDVTDEAGFDAVNAMSGMSIKIGDDERQTTAAYGLETVQATLAWLSDLIERGHADKGEGA